MENQSTNSNYNNDDLIRRFEELSNKYHNALNVDMEFEELKKNISELKDITIRVSQSVTEIVNPVNSFSIQ